VQQPYRYEIEPKSVNKEGNVARLTCPPW
jgi:hypothetical protein